MVALYRHGTRTVIALSSNYKGPPKDFAVVVPVPVVLKEEQVKTLQPQLFERLDAFTAPRLSEFWEHDPCHTLDYAGFASGMMGVGTASADSETNAEGAPNGGVKVEAQFVTGEYDVTILSATESDALEAWLRSNGFALPPHASEALAPYVKEQMKFFVAKVAIERTARDESGAVVLSPLRFEYESQDFRLPVRLGLLNARAKQDLVVFVLGDHRYEVANYPSVAAPTNVEVTEDTRAVFSAFYARLFDAAIARAGGNGVVTEFAGSPWACAPCTTKALNFGEIATLGADLEKGEYPAVITRLHARYDASSLNADLVLQAQTPIEGGKYGFDPSGRPLPVGKVGASPAATDAYAARYVIRHPWTGTTECANPEFGLWEDHPPAGQSVTPTSALGLAAAPRGTLRLRDHVTAGIADVDAWDRAADQGAVVPPVKSRACGCDVAGARPDAGAGVFGCAALALVATARRRRTPRRRGRGMLG
jgi:hypothetical protein